MYASQYFYFIFGSVMGTTFEILLGTCQKKNIFRTLFILQDDGNKRDETPSSMFKSILLNIIDSESNYVEWLNVLLQVLLAQIVIELFLIRIFFFSI